MLFLTGIALFMVGKLTTQTFTTLRFLQEKTQTTQSAALGLERLSSELREAVEVTSVDPLSFQKVNPSAPIALDYDQDPSPAANPGSPDFSVDPATWSDAYDEDAFGVNHLGRVSYQRVDNTVTRTAGFKTESLTTQVAERVNDFSVSQAPTLEGVTTGRNVFEVSLSITEDRRVVAMRTLVIVPGISP